MATFSKFNAFVEHLNEGVHDMANDTLKAALSNTDPTSSSSVWADVSGDEIAGGNGYTTGGVTLTVTTSSQTGGTYSLIISDETITATGGSIPTFRYVIMYNDTPVSPADPLICYWDHGSGISLANGESVTLDFSDANGAYQLS